MSQTGDAALGHEAGARPGLPTDALVWAFRIRRDGSAAELPTDQPIPHHHDGWLWLHVNLVDVRAGSLLRSLPDLPAAAADLLLSADEHQQLHSDEDCVYGVFADLVRALEGATADVGFLHFAMTERLLVSGRRRTLHAPEAARQALRGGRRIGTAGELLEAIVQHLIDAIDDHADALARELDGVEDRLIGTEQSDERQTLGRVRRTTLHLHRQLAGLRALFRRLELDAGPAAKPALQLRADRLSQRLDGLDHEIIALRDRAYLLQEEVMLKVAELTNRHLQVLAIVTTLLLPPSLVAGIFGMNTKGLPFTENDTGFLWSMAILVASIIGCFWLLRACGVIGRGGTARKGS